MDKVYIWKIKYTMNYSIGGESVENMTVCTKEDSFAEAERVANQMIDEKVKVNSIRLSGSILKIKRSIETCIS